MSLDPQYPSNHFTELVVNQLPGTLKSLASPGASNFYIGLQVEHAIEQKPDLIMVLFSNYDRVEIVGPGFEYLPKRGIRNIHQNRVDTSSTTTYSNVITNHLRRLKISREQANALSRWFSDVYDFGTSYHKDWFVCQGILHRLKASGIPFIFNPGGMTYHAADPEQAWIGFESNMAELNPWSSKRLGDSGPGSGVWHTSFEMQKKISENWLNSVKKILQKD